MPKVLKKSQAERGKRAREWKLFRERYLLSQKALGELIGVSRRLIQYVEAGEHDTTIEVRAKFDSLVKIYKAEGR